MLLRVSTVPLGQGRVTCVQCLWEPLRPHSTKHVRDVGEGIQCPSILLVRNSRQLRSGGPLYNMDAPPSWPQGRSQLQGEPELVLDSITGSGAEYPRGI